MSGVESPSSAFLRGARCPDSRALPHQVVNQAFHPARDTALQVVCPSHAHRVTEIRATVTHRTRGGGAGEEPSQASVEVTTGGKATPVRVPIARRKKR